MAKLEFDNYKTLFLILNIIGHDVIHDYHDNNSKRWSNVQTFIAKLTEGGRRGGAAMVDTMDIDRTSYKRPISNIDSVFNTMIDEERVKRPNLEPDRNLATDFEGEAETKEIKMVESEVKQAYIDFPPEMDPIVNEFIDHIRNQIMFRALDVFINNTIPIVNTEEETELVSKDEIKSDEEVNNIVQEMIHHNKETDVEISEPDLNAPVAEISDEIPVEFILNMQYEESYKQVTENEVEDEEDIEILNLQYNIVNKVVEQFYIFVKHCVGKKTFVNMYDFLDTLCNFLETSEVNDAVEENSPPMHVEDAMSGGFNNKILPMNGQESVFIDAINNFYTTNKNYFDEIDTNEKLIIEMAKEDFESNYKKKKTEIIDEVLNICSDYIKNFSQKEKEYLKKNMEHLYIDIPQKLGRTELNVPERVKSALFFCTIAAQAEVNKINIQAELAKANAAKEEAKKQKEEALAQKKLEREQEREQRAKDTGALLPKEKQSVDYFMKFIARSVLYLTGVCDANGKATKIPGEIVNEEIDCLLAIAEWKPKRKSKNLDTRLIEEIKERGFGNTEIPNLIEKETKFIINNAASIGDLQTKVFCPVTSIIDAMTSTCTWNSAQSQGIERGDMDFTITNNNGLSYQGKIVYGTDKEIITSTIVVTMPKIVINNSKTFNIKTATQLKAHVVLKNALVAVVEKVYEIRNRQTGNIWDALFSTSIIEPNKKFYKRFFGEILFKGTGDLFQEINAVAKNGGYTVNPTAGFIIEQFKSGNARRFFAANDRPSACRFMFMLKNGMPNQINQSAFGGYYSENQTVLFKRPTVGGNRRTKKRRVTKRKGYQRRNKTKSKKHI